MTCLQWESYLPWLHRMLVNQHKHSGDGNSICYTMLPDRSFGSLYIALEGETIGRLCKKARVLLPPKTSFVGNPVAWNKVFRLNRIGSQHDKPEPTVFFPGRSIRTDGVACSVTMQRLDGAPKLGKRKKASEDDLAPTSVASLHHPKLSDRLVGIDPGKRPDILVGISRASDTESEQAFKVSVKEWRERAGFNKRRQVCISCWSARMDMGNMFTPMVVMCRKKTCG